MSTRVVRLTFSLVDCRHDYESAEHVASGYARGAGLEVLSTRRERDTVAVYAYEPKRDDARAWDRYRALACTSATEVELDEALDTRKKV